MFDVTTLITAALFLVLALLCYRPARAYLQNRKNPEAAQSHGKGARSAEGRVVAAQRANLGAMFTPREHILYVDYEVGGERLQSTLTVSQRAFNHYQPIIKKLSKQLEKTGEQPPIEELPTITVYYKNKDPKTIWCDDSMKAEENQGRTFLVLGIVCLAVAAYFAFAAFSG